MLKVLFFAAAIAMAQCDNEVETAFKDSEIVPDLLSVPPSTELQLQYSDSSLEVHLGNEVKPSQVTVRPDILYSLDEDSYYTFLMTDLDAPSRENPTFREYLHCLIGNIQSDGLANGQIFVEYMGPAPGEGTGLHRYVFLLFEQTGIIIVDPEEVAERANFSTRNFVDQHSLGVPVAGNFFLAQNENN